MEALQRQLCSRYGAEFLASPAELKLGISRSALEGMQPLNGLRHPPEGGTCGWYIWGGTEWSDAPDFFLPLHVTHLARDCPKVLPYLGLPAGWRFLIVNGHKDVWFDAELLRPAK